MAATKEFRDYLKSRSAPPRGVPISTQLAAGYTHKIEDWGSYADVLKEIRDPGSRFNSPEGFVTRPNRPTPSAVANFAAEDAVFASENIKDELLQFSRGELPEGRGQWRHILSTVRDRENNLVGILSADTTVPDLGMTHVGYMAVLPGPESEGVSKFMFEDISSRAVGLGEGITFDRLRYSKNNTVVSNVEIPYEKLRTKINKPIEIPKFTMNPPQNINATQNALQRMEQVNAAAASALPNVSSSINRSRKIGKVARMIGRFR